MEDSFVNIWEVILTLLWQSGLLNQRLYVISLSICYWLFKCGVLRVMCVCVRERESKLQRCVCVCACVCERVRQGHTTTACVQTHTSFITVSVTRLCSASKLELMVKLRSLLTVFTFSFEMLKLAIMERGVTFLTRLVMFGQSKCTGSVGQSEQTALIGRRDFVENEAFERGGA